jgi:non-specific serine/threonine protein kinase/serine/threonine-protein kinase
VALKVIPAGPDSDAALAGLGAERGALGRLDHPSLARVLDAGMAEDGRAWFATEWVPGVPFTEHCDRERLGVRERLQLFAEVCEAIHHAHTQGVVHRNLKPSKVLVTTAEVRPRPKVVDLGGTATLDPERRARTLYTAAGLLAGPPGHLSPEHFAAGPRKSVPAPTSTRWG